MAALTTGLSPARDYAGSVEQSSGVAPEDDQIFTAAEINAMIDGIDNHASLIDAMQVAIDTVAIEGVDVDSTGVADGLVLTADGSGNSAWEAATGTGDMLKSENLSGLANYATARTNLGVDPAGTDNSDNNAVNTRYSSLVSNATHTGDVTGATVLTIAADAVTYPKMQNVVANNVLLGNNAGAGGAVAELGAVQVRTILGVEAGATADQTGAEIKAAYEAEPDTNAFTDANVSTLASALQLNSALGTPASGVATNLTGTAAGLTAGTVTTNANLTGHITSSGNATALGSFTLAQLNTAISDGTVDPAGTDNSPAPKNSIEVDATELQLVGDALAPGVDKLYGTNGAGTKGWYSIPTGGAEVNDLSANVTWANVPDANITQSSVTQHNAAIVAGSANALESATTTVSVSAATAPTTGQVLTATSGTTATWQAAGGVTDHGALTGLGDDDHSQYHTDARGDARYYTQTAADSLLAAKAPTSHTHVKANITDFSDGDYATATQGGKADTALQLNPALGTPVSGVATNLTGTAAGLTAGTVTTNANLTGHITSSGNAAVLGSFTLAQLNTAISDGTVDADTSTPVTFTGAGTYLTLAGQQITVDPIDLATDVTGDLPVADGGTGASTASAARTNLGLVINEHVVGVPTVRTTTAAAATTDADIGNIVILANGHTPTLHATTTTAKKGQTITFFSEGATELTFAAGGTTMRGKTKINQWETMTATCVATGTTTATVWYLTGGRA